MLTEGLDRLLSFKKREAAFRRTVRAAHELFCRCGDPVQHLLGWRTTFGGRVTTDHEGTGGDDTKEGATTEDQDMVAATEDAEW